MKKFIAILLITLAVLSLISGCGKSDKYDTFSYKELTIQTPQNMKFKEGPLEGYDYALQSDKIYLFVATVSKDEVAAAGIDPEELKDYVFEGMTIEQVGITSTANYTNSVGDDTFFYTYSLVESDTTFYDIHMACAASDQAVCKDIMYDIISKLEIKN